MKEDPLVESHDGFGSKGPLKVIESNPPARCGEQGHLEPEQLAQSPEGQPDPATSRDGA